ncbi:MAG: zinc ribbon domain-containing protein [Christensenellales bacterium]
MSPYKNFLAATKAFFNSNAFLKFLLSAQIFIFAAGGLFYLLGLFIIEVYEAFVCLGTILIWAGLLLSVIKEDSLTMVISSGTIALGSLVAWIIGLAGRNYGFGIVVGGSFLFTPFFYFLIFAAIAIVIFVKAEKFRSMRAASAAKSAGYACPGCGNFVAYTSAFCPSCGTKRPEQQYAPPAQPVQSAAPASEATGNKCVSCGADLPEGAAFCGKCGSEQ